MRSVYVPPDAELPAFKVSVDVPAPSAGTLTELGRLTITFAGGSTQDVVRSTSELKLFTEEMIREVDRKAPGLRLIVAGKGCAMKSGDTASRCVPGGVTVRVRVVECDIGPLEAVTVSGYVPTATVAGTKIDSVTADVPPEVVAIESIPVGDVPGFTLNEPATPVGANKESRTGDAKLDCESTNTVRLLVDPCAIVIPVVESPIEKSPEYSMNPHELAWQTPFE